MTRALAPALAVVAAACGGEKAQDRPPPPQGSAIAVVVPEITSIDWASFTYELASLGPVKATGGRAVFRIVEDELGLQRADQSEGPKGEWTGTLAVEPARYADLDGDGHDEALIAFELASTQLDEVPRVFGVFAYTLRDGDPVRLAVVTSPAKITIDGATLNASDPPRTWRWRAGRFVAE